MAKLTELLIPDNIRQGLVCSSKKRVFEIIGKIVASQFNDENNQENEHTCFECLYEREKLGNSSLGNGVAFPKGRLPDGDKPIAVFLQLKTGIDYNALDHRDIDLIFALLIPTNICSQYSEDLAKITTLLTDKSICKQLRAAQNKEEIWQIFENIDSQQEILSNNQENIEELN
ncbi:phosphotransferase IIA-like nitrogen-regulatory protein PtsN [Bisgaardia hudsonensis]|uniref:Phosphotransferase IIA-like nitrogen-regulatory protein PtsN n=1 Tax=Bisgaardia hudsonensis TaxID=109472 RepID=A0A4V2SJ28_9PAST|nr:PTS IIA-like nitrogen regulatory protein PtsN [Bisgaardia hudsonensis]QLB13347.1 PTS IIA-like nitrogen-regulatory protein PtsN [Bisgaardia hudsonensis]TCP12748.1 phosphotransferase IIA-like nitrogen-regulatory protein PtsN [Bisgaardia hudsonensis]